MKEKKAKKKVEVGGAGIRVEGVKTFNVKQVAKMLGITSLTTRKYLQEKRLIGQKVGRGWVVTLSNLQAFINSAWAGKSKKKK